MHIHGRNDNNEPKAQTRTRMHNKSAKPTPPTETTTRRPNDQKRTRMHNKSARPTQPTETTAGGQTTRNEKKDNIF